MGNAFAFLVALLSRPSQPPPQVASPPKAATKNTQQMIQEARSRLQLDVTRNYNFAFCGSSGSGKTSLINALRGLPDNAAGAGPTGETETTGEVCAYPYPRVPHVVLWDMPGGGTPKHPAPTYFEDKVLFAFDCLIIVCANRFTELDLEIAKKAKEWNVPVAFARNKFDASLEAALRRSSSPSVSRAEVARELKEQLVKDIRTHLKANNLGDSSVYLVSAWRFLDDKLHPMDEEALVRDVANLAAQRRQQKPA